MSDNPKEIDETQLQEILRKMSKMSKRKSPKRRPPRKSGQRRDPPGDCVPVHRGPT